MSLKTITYFLGCPEGVDAADENNSHSSTSDIMPPPPLALSPTRKESGVIRKFKKPLSRLLRARSSDDTGVASTSERSSLPSPRNSAGGTDGGSSSTSESGDTFRPALHLATPPL